MYNLYQDPYLIMPLMFSTLAHPSQNQEYSDLRTFGVNTKAFWKLSQTNGITHQCLEMLPKNLNSKLKHVRLGLKKWSKNFSQLNKLIYNSNWVLLLDGLEDQRPLSWLESAFRMLVKSHLASLLESKRIYWK